MEHHKPYRIGKTPCSAPKAQEEPVYNPLQKNKRYPYNPYPYKLARGTEKSLLALQASQDR